MQLKKTAQEMIDFISANLKVGKHELMEVYFRNYARCLSEKTGSTFDYLPEGVCNHHATRYMVNPNNPVEQEAQRWIQYIQSSGIDYADFLQYEEHKWLFRKDFRKTKYPNIFQGGGLMVNLVHIALDLQGMNGDLTTFKQANDYIDNLGVDRRGLLDAKIGELKVKQYKNGRVDIVGLTDQQRSQLDLLFAIHNKISML